MHWSTFFTLSTQVVWEAEMRDLSCWNSASFSMTSVADWKAALSSSSSLSIWACNAFSNASFLAGAEIVGGWQFKNEFPAGCAGPQSLPELEIAVIPLLVLAPAALGDPDVILLVRFVVGALQVGV